jgi:hemerythrin
MPLLVDPQKLPRLPVPFMNEDHAEEARCVNAVSDALAALDAERGDRAAVLAALEALYAQSQAHFAREETAMQNASFPGYSSHQAEHVRILSELGEAERNFREGGEPEELRAFVRTLPAWLSGHIESMDTASARYISEWGG